MSAFAEYLPALGQPRQDIVLLHGWGMGREVWRPLLATLRNWANVTLLELPGCAPQGDTANAPELEQLLDQIEQACPERAVFVGWSLGGQLAVAIAQRSPGRVAALVTLCSNPRFVADEHWPGMAPDVFEAFDTRVREDVNAALGRFQVLQLDGAEQPRALRRWLRALPAGPGGRSLFAGLDWLRELDQRQCLAAADLPQLHLFAASDALVPAGCEQALSRLLAGKEQVAVKQLPQGGHLGPLAAPADLAAEVEVFLVGARLLVEEADDMPQVEKAAVANSFSRAAASYDSVAHLQRDVGEQLLRRLDSLAQAPRVVLDLGCGTGYFRQALQARFPGATYIGLDIASGMVEYARARDGESDECAWLVGDAEALPLAADSVDLVFSSLAVQWCYRPQLLFAELYRVLRPGGSCHFSSLGPDTLKELRGAWAAVDAHQHVNEFICPQRLQADAATVHGLQFSLVSEAFLLHYERVGELLAELKALGAHNMNRGRPAGLTSRRTLAGMVRAYEQWREGGLLPATYDVIFANLVKGSEAA